MQIYNELFWQAWKRSPHSRAYNISMAFSIEGDLQEHRLVNALNELISNHKVFTSRFSYSSNNLQMFQADFDGDCVDRIKIQAKDIELNIQRIRQHVFDLTQFPLFKIGLINVRPNFNILVLCFHHIICDGIAEVEIIKYVSNHYSDRISQIPLNRSSEFSYCLGNREFLTKTERQAAAEYWSIQAGSFSEIRNDLLAIHSAAGVAKQKEGSFSYFELDAETVSEINQFSKAHKSSCFCFLLTTYLIVLSQLSDCLNWLVCYAVNMRPQEMGGVLGCFTNILPFFATLTSTMTCFDFFNYVTSIRKEQKPHQNLPFTEILQILRSQLEMDINPFLNIGLVQTHVKHSALQLDGLDVNYIEETSNESIYDLCLEYEFVEDKMELRLNSRTGIFDQNIIDNFSNYFCLVVKEILHQPKKRVSDILLLSDADKFKVVVECNQAEVARSAETILPALISQQAKASPHRPALTYKDATISYSDLEQQSCGLAKRLYSEQDGSKTAIIPLLIGPGVDRIIVMLAVMKMGAAYVPIDDSFPPERIADIFRDCQPPFIILDKQYSDKVVVAKELAQMQGVALFYTDDMSPFSDLGGALPTIVQNDLAYVLYTSGSTGKPKGVKISHGALANFILAMQELLGATKHDNTINLTPYTFDISALEIYLPLVVGARCVLADSAMANHGGKVSKAVNQYCVRIVQTSPTKWQLLLDSGFSSVNAVLLSGGEVLSRELANILLLKGEKVWNMYGPTETTVWSTAYCISELDSVLPNVPIGKPIANNQVFVLGKDLLPVPVGKSGELYIGGAGVAKGYLNNEVLTRKRFIQCPIAIKKLLKTNICSRLYKTGDLVKWTKEGDLLCLGREDRQVKHNGYRIELGDIESVLRSYGKIKDVAVIRRKIPDNKQFILLAYYTLHPGQENAADQQVLRNYLTGTLPHYCIPNNFIQLDKMPLTLSGKLDLSALDFPEPVSNACSKDSQLQAKSFVVGIWEEILNRPIPSLEMDFFGLGGDSLSALRICHAVERQFHIDCPVDVLLSHSKLRQFISWVGADQAPCLHGGFSITKSRKRKNIPLSMAQRQFWMLSELSMVGCYNITLAWSLRGRLLPQVLIKALNHMRKQNSIFRTVYKKGQNGLCQEIIPYKSIDLKVESISEYELLPILAKEKSQGVKELSGKPANFKILYVDSSYYVLVLSVNHISFDEVSINIFVKKLSSLYLLVLKNAPIIADKNAVQYSDYAIWSLRDSDEKLHLAMMSKWRKYLHDYREVNLPRDFSRPKEASFLGEEYKFRIESELLIKLKALSAQSKSTVFSLILSVFYVLLQKYTSENDITIGIPVNLRDSLELFNTMGCFANTLPMRCKLEGRMSFSDVISHVNESMRFITNHNRVNLNELVSMLQLERNSSAIPLVSILATWEGRLGKENLKFPDVFVKPVQMTAGFAKTDIHLNCVECEDAVYCKFEYATDLFQASTIENLAIHFLKLVEEFINDPNCNISEVSMLTLAEYNQLVQKRSVCKTQFPLELDIYHHVEQRVLENHNAIALRYEDSSFTYKQLNERVVAIADALYQLVLQSKRSLVSDYVVVGLHLKRSLFMAAAILGIFKARFVYLPIAIDLPKERVAYMLAKSGCSLVISDDELFFESKDIQQLDFQVVTEATLQSQSNSMSKVNRLNTRFDSGHPAYVLFTSGSTGHPKAVLVSHRSVVNCLYSVSKYIKLSSADVFLSVTDYSFDVSVLDFLLPLVCGGELIIAGDQLRKDPTYIATLLSEYRVTAMQATPTTWQTLIQHGWRGRKHFKILSAGEALTTNLSWKLAKRGDLYNLYGPTEATIYTTIGRIYYREKPSIGKPIDNVACYVLDENMKPLPVGIFGELYIGGAGVAIGYLGDDALDKERFLDDPFSSEKQARMYKTGDIVRWNVKGNIEFLGRRDDQVKLRGYRIELSEIENQLLTHPNIKQASVIYRNNVEDRCLVAFFVPDKKGALLHENLSRYLRDNIPTYMIPSYFIEQVSFPTTLSGKVDKNVLSKIFTKHKLLKTVSPKLKETASTPVKRLKSVFEGILGKAIDDTSVNLFDLGMHSLLFLEAQGAIAKSFGKEIPLVKFFSHPSILELSKILAERQIDSATEKSNVSHPPLDSSETSEIAIIGFSGQFPGAADLDEFWDNLLNGRDTISSFSDDELREHGVPEELINDPNYVKARGMLKDAEYFDADFFNINPAEAVLLDPQQRIFLENTWTALEHAGYSPDKCQSVIGVYAGADESKYASHVLHQDTSYVGSIDDFQRSIANQTQSLLSSKISYKLNLTGPSLNINTACSTGLVVVATACQQLLDRQCDMAIAGSVSVKQPQISGYLYYPEGITSPNKHCSPFSGDAVGTVPSAGVGVVILKRLADAIADKDCILAVIKGWHVNNDGSYKVGYTATSVKQQEECIVRALKKAKISAEEIGYVEAHGTGTKLGDPVEISALSQAFRRSSDKAQNCAVGSVKSNIGHADAASGLAGLLKTIQMLRHKTFVPSLHCEKTSEEIDFETSPLYVNTKKSAWISNDASRTAAVNSLGIGGTNAFMILEEFSENLRVEDNPYKSQHVFPFSAKSPGALRLLLQEFKQYLLAEKEKGTVNEGAFLSNIAFTLQQGRSEFPYRRCFVASLLDELIAQLAEVDVSMTTETVARSVERSETVLFFPGQGVQYRNMGALLYQTDTVFSNAFDLCVEKFDLHLPINLKDVLFCSNESKYPDDLLSDTKYTQPILFCIEYSIAQLLLFHGLKPDMLLGQSLGEYVAAQIAGVFSLDDVIDIVSYRSRLISELETGSMLAVNISADVAEQYFEGPLSIATIVSPSSCVVSGDCEAISALQKTLLAEGVVNEHQMRLLNVSHAFHSISLNCIRDKFVAYVSKFKLHVPTIPIVTNLSGELSCADEFVKAEYWGQHLVSTVQLSKGFETIVTSLDKPLFITVGPSPSLASLVKPHMRHGKSFVTVRTMLTEKEFLAEDTDKLLYHHAIAKAWLNHATIDWNFYASNEAVRRIPLPTHPFQRQAFWPTQLVHSSSDRNRIAIKEPFQRIVWQRAESIYGGGKRVFRKPSVRHQWIVFCGSSHLAHLLCQNFLKILQNVIFIFPGDTFSQESDLKFSFNPSREQDYMTLSEHIFHQEVEEYFVIDLLPLYSHGSDFEESVDLDLYHLVRFMKSYSMSIPDKKMNIAVITQGVFSVFAGDAVSPENAMVLGAVQVIPYEFSKVGISCIDIDEYSVDHLEQIAHSIILESITYAGSTEANCIAYRQGYRWVRGFNEVSSGDLASETDIKKDGVYLILGGLGGIGLKLAEMIALKQGATVVLLSRKQLPAQQNWNFWLAENSTDHEQFYLIKQLNDIHMRGGKLLIVSADATSADAMRGALSIVSQQVGVINGVIGAAGLPGSGLIVTKQKQSVLDVVENKLKMVSVLSQLLKDCPIDFVCFFSSVVSVVGGVGQLEYCAANACLDGVPDAGLFHKNTRVIVMNWNKWRDTGMRIAVRPSGDEAYKALMNQYTAFFENNSIAADEGCLLFLRALQQYESHLVVSNRNVCDFKRDLMTSAVKLQQVAESIGATPSDEADVDLQDPIALMVATLLGLSSVDMKDNFFELGGDSLVALKLLYEIKQRFGATVAMSELYTLKTLTELRDMVFKQKYEAVSNSPLVKLCSGDDVFSPIFLIHPVGGTVTCYHELVNCLTLNRTVYAIEDPGLTSDGFQFSTMEEMAAYYIEYIRSVSPTGPYCFIGYSFGGNLAFEMSSQLLANNEQVEFLGLIDSWAKLSNVFINKNYFKRVMARQLEGDSENYRATSPETLLACQWSRMQLLKNYLPRRLPVQLHLYKARDLLPEYQAIDDAYNHWVQYSTVSIDCKFIPGDHETLLKSPNVQMLSEMLTQGIFGLDGAFQQAQEVQSV